MVQVAECGRIYEKLLGKSVPRKVFILLNRGKMRFCKFCFVWYWFFYAYISLDSYRESICSKPKTIERAYLFPYTQSNICKIND